MSMKEIVMWAHSECRSTMALFREITRLAGVPVTIALWKYGIADSVRQKREKDGQKSGAYADLKLLPIGDDLTKGRDLLMRHGGPETIQVFCVYQISSVWRRLIVEAKRGGAKVVIYAEAPCEMCCGPKAKLKRLYYRYVLPFKLKKIPEVVDVFLSQSGQKGVERLIRIGWDSKKIIPFGYASDPEGINWRERRFHQSAKRPLRILHTGVETPYRDVDSLRRAVSLLKDDGLSIELITTGGKSAPAELNKQYVWADVFVACGVCEPWGMRVVDAIHAGLPVIVSDGMGVEWIVGTWNCGYVYKAGSYQSLAAAIRKFIEDDFCSAEVLKGVRAAHFALCPERRAIDFISAITN